MKEQILNEVVARRFWLGQLAPEEQGRIEELGFKDPQSFAFLQAAEDDLIDEFVYGDLSAEERARFQDYFLAQPGRREDLRTARALREYFDRKPLAPSFWERLWQWIHNSAPTLIPAVVAAAIIIVAIIWLAPRIRELFRRSSEPQQAEQQQPSVLPTPASTASQTPVQSSPSPALKDDQNKHPSTPRRSTSPAYAIVLAPGGPVRSGGAETSVSLTSGPAYFELPIIGNSSYRTYQATLEKDGQTLKTWPNLKATRISTGKGVRIRAPSDQLNVSQRYLVVLKGVAASGNLVPVEKYYFRVLD